VLVVGNARDAFVTIPNRFGATSFEEVVGVILKNQFGGGCSTEAISDYLHGAGVIRKRLTPSMLSGDAVVMVDGQVMLKGLA
jgi:hypothetical protein